MKGRFPLLLLVLFPFAAVAAQGYKVIHPDGSIEFTDQPERDAVEVDLPNAQGYQSSTPVPPPSSATLAPIALPNVGQSVSANHQDLISKSPDEVPLAPR